ncbi:MAG: hypothetical protein ACKVPX_18305 [Myxococcaceae bacterium]
MFIAPATRLCSRLTLAIIAGLLGMTGVASAQVEVTANVQAYANSGANGPANLVSNAVPFAPGVVTNPALVRVLDGGTEVPVAARVLATWPSDGSVRSLLLQFEAPTPRSYTIAVGIARGTSDRAFIPVTWDVPTRVFTLPASHLSSSLVFWEQLPLGQTGFPDWDTKQLNAFSRIATVGTAACAREDQYYDAITTSYQLYARTGNITYLTTARRWALHHRRDQIVLSGTYAGHGNCTGGYLNNTRYTFLQGLSQDYLMFGDEEAKNVSALVADNFYRSSTFSWWWYKAPNSRGFWTEREPAFALNGILAHYEITGDVSYLNFARDRVAQLRQMQVDNGNRAWVHNLYDHDPSEGCAQTDWGSSPWMSGLLLEGIIKYHKLTGDNVARESILMAVDDLRARYLATGSNAGVSFIYLGCSAYRDGAPDLDNLISHAFGYAYRLTGNAVYRTVGTNLFNTAVRDGVTASAKHYDQQFRNSGHFPAYLADPTPPTARPRAPTRLRAVQ